jgi:hypothetical protein
VKLRLLAKDQNSGRTGCPSCFADDDTPGMGIVWSNRLTWRESIRHIPNRLRGERGVRIKMDVLCAAVDEYRAGQA